MINLLIVDDEVNIVTGIRDNIPWNEYGIRVCGIAGNGAQALDLLMTTSPDIIIMDICMPQISGIELLEIINEKYPNITGAFLDDYFNIFLTNDSDANERIYNDLKSIREKLSKANRPMELYVVWYTHHFQAIDPKVMQFIDGLTLWTWEYRNLKRISDNFEFTEKLFPDKKKLLGIYLLDYPSGMPVPNEYMELQCEYGLKLLKEGRADGLIICTNCVMGVGLPSEKWLRGWIERVKDIEIPD